jgi:hypothetical protein
MNEMRHLQRPETRAEVIKGLGVQSALGESTCVENRNLTLIIESHRIKLELKKQIPENQKSQGVSHILLLPS